MEAGAYPIAEMAWMSALAAFMPSAKVALQILDMFFEWFRIHVILHYTNLDHNWSHFQKLQIQILFLVFNSFDGICVLPTFVWTFCIKTFKMIYDFDRVLNVNIFRIIFWNFTDFPIYNQSLILSQGVPHHCVSFSEICTVRFQMRRNIYIEVPVSINVPCWCWSSRDCRTQYAFGTKCHLVLTVPYCLANAWLVRFASKSEVIGVVPVVKSG